MTKFNDCKQILKEELIEATGCTEPSAIALASSRMRQLLGSLPDHIDAILSGNIIKNVKAVSIPNTGKTGIKAAVNAGLIGDYTKGLKVINDIKQDNVPDIPVNIKYNQDTPFILDIEITGHKDNETATVRIINNHTNIVYENVNGKVLLNKVNDCSISPDDGYTSKDSLNVRDILDFVNSNEVKDIYPLIERQVNDNIAISKYGAKHSYGANIGRTLNDSSININNINDGNIGLKMKSLTASGSDARMAGCAMPVVILSGSGNQGITASVPLIVLAQEYGIEYDRMLRSIVLSDLIALEQKRGIGRLSAYCAVVSASVGVAAGIAYLLDGSYKAIAHSIVNALEINSGIICTGANSHCAAKIASSIDAAILGYLLYENGNQFRSGEGLVVKGVDENIIRIGELAKQGMAETDKLIINLMIKGNNESFN